MKLEDQFTKVIAQDLNIDGMLDSCWITSNKFVLAGALGNLYYYSFDLLDIKMSNTIAVDHGALCLSVDFCNDKLGFFCYSYNIVVLHQSCHQYLKRRGCCPECRQ